MLEEIGESEHDTREDKKIRTQCQWEKEDPCSDPQSQSDPIGESEPKPRGRSFNSFYFYILLCFLFQKCRDPNPRLDPVGGSEPEPGLLRRFQLSYQKIFFMLYIFRFSICTEAFSNGRPTNIHISQNAITVKAFYALSK